MHITHFRSNNLYIENLFLEPGVSYCFFGSDSSGINSLFSLLAGDSEAEDGIDSTLQPSAVLSFKQQQEIFEEEVRNDETDFLGTIDHGTRGRDFIDNPELCEDLIDALNMRACLDKGYRQLSTGESRKILLLSYISQNPSSLLIENPFDGLDTQSCLELSNGLARLNDRGCSIFLFINNLSDIPEWCNNLVIIQEGKLLHSGNKNDVLKIFDDQTKQESRLKITIDDENPIKKTGELVRLANGKASYGETVIFSEIDLLVNSGDHTLITGPNGSGKSTLLHIITGDNHNCYVNDLFLFGQKRGSGESIWDIKRKMGIVSPELHRNHYIPGSALQVVLSGFFDSIGVYTSFSSTQMKQAEHWLTMVGLTEKSKVPFRMLSFTEQKLCLIARALIKTPQLLILDEPTQGLDQHMRTYFLDILERIADKNISTILYASHRQDEYRSFFKIHLGLNHFSR